MKVENHVSVHSNLNLNGFSNSGGTDRTHRTANLGKEVIERKIVDWDYILNFRFPKPASNFKEGGRRGGTASVKHLMCQWLWWRTIRMLLSVNKHILVSCSSLSISIVGQTNSVYSYYHSIVILCFITYPNFLESLASSLPCPQQTRSRWHAINPLPTGKSWAPPH